VEKARLLYSHEAHTKESARVGSIKPVPGPGDQDNELPGLCFAHWAFGLGALKRHGSEQPRQEMQGAPLPINIAVFSQHTPACSPGNTGPWLYLFTDPEIGGEVRGSSRKGPSQEGAGTTHVEREGLQGMGVLTLVCSLSKSPWCPEWGLAW
jgi:hypothetical protein